jgi:TPP-dependent pyruvate/acetoin dehydrogenase alpha subunit
VRKDIGQFLSWAHAEGQSGLVHALTVTKDGLFKMYKEMVTMRRMEQSADAPYKSKLICGFCHLTIGRVRSLCLLVRFLSDESYCTIFSFRKPSRLALNHL